LEYRLSCPSPWTTKDLVCVCRADGADSDSPGGYRPPAADQANNGSREAPQPLNQEGGDDEATKGNGRRSDGDDPKAPLIIRKSDQPQDEIPLNDGREPSAKPIPEGQRVAVAAKSVEPDATELGRDPNAKPGAELTNPAKATPTTKPATPSRKTLADLSEAIQALDKDGDGQLGLYEWPRAKLAEFKTLDSNKDGFLTPAELVAGQKKASDAGAAKTEKEPAAKTDDSSKPEDAKTPAADTTDKEEPKAETKEETKDATPDSSTDGADSKDDSSADDQPTQGS
ncbi:MAG: hypothetical protein O3C40_19650, partial [Planctomycetota bacterium]|nr:hypothetical protein [Planctomycetota bacterium]